MNLNLSISNSKKRILVKLFILLVFIFLLDCFLGFGVKYLFETGSDNNLCPAEMFKRAINIKPEILILGSSRAQHHYNPVIIEEKTGLTAYNLGIGGTNSLTHKYIIKLMLQYFKPKIIVLDIFYPLAINDNLGKYRTINYVYPFVEKFDNFPELTEISPLEKYLLKLKFYKYHTIVYPVLKSRAKKRSDYSIKGYFPITEINKMSKIDSLKYDLEDESKMNVALYLLDIIKMCQKDDIKLILSVSPFYALNNDQIPQKILTNVDSNKTFILEYNNNKFNINDGDLFKDLAHLNRNGADKFSKIFAEDLNKILKR